MLTTGNISEIHQIIESNHSNPHNILGMHESTFKSKKIISIRAFIPQAKSITVVNCNSSKSYEMKKIHIDGFFELNIEDCTQFFKYYFICTGYDGNIWETYDPYSYLPFISEEDRYLFCEGTHYQIFDKLGAHLITVDGVEGAFFGVWAPNAKRVSVIGDFNSWDGRRNPMRVLGQSGIWEIFIPNIKKFDRYKFEIKTYNNNILEKSDPYSNFNELRPSKTSLVYDVDDYKWSDNNWLNNRDKNNSINGPINIYEVHLGSWKKSDQNQREFMSFLELKDDLIPYVKEMGYTHIELMPVTEFPFDGSWGYQVTGYYAVTSRFGTPHEFMEFVDHCHTNNIGVILDWVPAHFPKDEHGLSNFDGTALYEHADPRQGEHPDWGTLIFNYGRSEVKNFLIGNAIYWLKKFHIDGLRVDAVASMLYLDYGKEDGGWIPNKYGGRENIEAVEFLKHMNSIIHQQFPNVIMAAEESTSWPAVSRPVEQHGLGFNLKWNMGWMNDFLGYIKEDPLFRKYHHGELTFSMVYAFTENFIQVLSHDEVVHGKGSIINKMPGDLWQKFANLRLTYGFMFGHPGKKLLFMGSEFGQFDEWNEKKSLDWFLLDYEHHRGASNFVKDLNHLYKTQPAMWYDDFTPDGFQWINCDDSNNSILSFIRKSNKKDETLVFVCNFTPNTYPIFNINMPYEGSYKEILNSDSYKYWGSNVINENIITTTKDEYQNNVATISVPPLGVTVLKIN